MTGNLLLTVYTAIVFIVFNPLPSARGNNGSAQWKNLGINESDSALAATYTVDSTIESGPQSGQTSHQQGRIDPFTDDRHHPLPAVTQAVGPNASRPTENISCVSHNCTESGAVREPDSSTLFPITNRDQVPHGKDSVASRDFMTGNTKTKTNQTQRSAGEGSTKTLLAKTHVALNDSVTHIPKDMRGELYVVDSANCTQYGLNRVFELPGTIEIRGRSSEQNVDCFWDIVAPPGHVIILRIENYNIPCHVGMLMIKEAVTEEKDLCSYAFCSPVYNPPPLIYSLDNRLIFIMFFRHFLTKQTLVLSFNFTRNLASHLKLNVNFTTPNSGFIVSPYYSETPGYQQCIRDSYTLEVPENQFVMVSFLDFRQTLERYSSFLGVYEVDSMNKSQRLLWKTGPTSNVPATQIYNNTLHFRFILTGMQVPYNFKLAFIFLNVSTAPRMNENGKFECSSTTHPTVLSYLACNFVVECKNGQDELNCPEVTDKCNGSWQLGHKCYSVMTFSGQFSWSQAAEFCEKEGKHLVTVKSNSDWVALHTLLNRRKSSRDVSLGLRTALFSLPVYYRHTWHWVDKTTNYFSLPTETTDFIFGAVRARNCFTLAAISRSVYTHSCDEKLQVDAICEEDLSLSITKSVSPVSAEAGWNVTSAQRMSLCRGGHVTHDFLVCDPSANCQRDSFESECDKQQRVYGTFSCLDGQRIPFTLVCDHQADCQDKTDETFCQHKPCKTTCSIDEKGCSLEDHCDNRQCIRITSVCDSRQDCRDGSDESKCVLLDRVQNTTVSQEPYTKIDFDGVGGFKVEPLKSTNECPETHFQCPDSYCLPVYLRCNGVYDCPGWEDEADCDTYTCPGFYRCRSSAICLHADHVCDGVFQCPRHDDELVCGLSCPEGCQCQGLAFVCATPFPAQVHEQVRYVDASGSGMAPRDFDHNHYLVFLRLARCGIQSLNNLTMPNLMVLDLSDNRLETLSTGAIHGLGNLQRLMISNNPIVALITPSNPQTAKFVLETIDLSGTRLPMLSKDAFSSFPRLRILNMSFSALKSFPDGIFRYNSRLEVLDVRSTDLQTFPVDLLKMLPLLKTVHSKNYRLCCRDVLPSHFQLKNCFAPSDEISSCEDLLRSDLYRLFLWLFVVLSMTGNAGSLLFRLFVQKVSAGGGYNVFVTNLSAADLLMGIYLLIIGVVDHTYRGSYLWHDVVWKMSAVCKVAGFVSLLSNEVSAFIIFLITLDRFIAFRFPLGGLRFQRRSALAACGVTWFTGLLLAAVPLLPMTSHWEYYSQTGLCIPLPVTRTQFRGRDYSFGVMIVLNLIIFLLIAGGQASIFWSVRVNSMRGDFTSTTKRTQDAIIARRLITVALSDFVCWFPIGLCGVLASRGVAIPGEVSVAMAIFVLPVNSALNPFLYTINMLIEKRRQARKTQRRKRLEEALMNKLGISAADFS